jgi:hypothetical protein
MGHGGRRDHHRSALLRAVLRHPREVGHVAYRITLHTFTPLRNGREDKATVNGRGLLVGEGDPRVDAGFGEAQAGLDIRTMSTLFLLRAIAGKMTGTPASQAAKRVAAVG